MYASGPACILKIKLKSDAYLHMGPVASIFSWSGCVEGGCCVLLLITPEEALWPKIPLKKAGIRMLPPISEPMPMTLPAPPTKLPSPPELPPTSLEIRILKLNISNKIIII